MLGLVWEIPSHRRKRANLVCTLARSQLLDRVRLEAVVQSRDLSRQVIDEHLGRIELPPGGVRITDLRQPYQERRVGRAANCELAKRANCTIF
jgi:hypothetical protein